MSLRDSKYWDKELEGGLPDSRLSGMDRERKKIFFGGLWWERVYCCNCGADQGLVTEDWAAHIFAVCDECTIRNGPPPNCIEAPIPDDARKP